MSGNYLKQSRVDMPHWGQQHLAALLGISTPMFGRYLNGLSYPTIQMMQKFEVIFGWPVIDQVPLIPYFWTWPLQNQAAAGVVQEEATDLRYGMKLRRITQEWGEANPRTQKLQDIRLHPSVPARRGLAGRTRTYVK